MDVLSLLQSQNRCLERFLSISKEFLATDQRSHQAEAAENTDFSESLIPFQEQRENILKAYALFDRKVSEAITLLPYSQRTPELIAGAKEAVERKNALIREILLLDTKIMSAIEEERQNLLQQVSSTRKSKDMLSKFKSTWMSEPGEEFDIKL